MIQYLPNIAMFCLLVGTLPSIAKAIKNRTNLIGFSFIGALGLLLGQFLFVIYFAFLGDAITVLFELPLVTYWLLVVIFTKKTVSPKVAQEKTT